MATSKNTKEANVLTGSDIVELITQRVSVDAILELITALVAVAPEFIGTVALISDEQGKVFAAKLFTQEARYFAIAAAVLECGDGKRKLTILHSCHEGMAPEWVTSLGKRTWGKAQAKDVLEGMIPLGGVWAYSAARRQHISGFDGPTNYVGSESF